MLIIHKVTRYVVRSQLNLNVPFGNGYHGETIKYERKGKETKRNETKRRIVVDQMEEGCNRLTESLERGVKLSVGAPVLCVLDNVCALVASCCSSVSEACGANAREMVMRVMIGCVSTNHKTDYEICANSSLADRDSRGEKCLMSCRHFFFFDSNLCKRVT